jgi:hypothetical protein
MPNKGERKRTNSEEVSKKIDKEKYTKNSIIKNYKTHEHKD